MYAVHGADLTHGGATLADALLLLTRITKVIFECIMEAQSWKHYIFQSCVFHISFETYVLRDCHNYTAAHIHMIKGMCRRREHDLHK